MTRYALYVGSRRSDEDRPRSFVSGPAESFIIRSTDGGFTWELFARAAAANAPAVCAALNAAAETEAVAALHASIEDGIL